MLCVIAGVRLVGIDLQRNGRPTLPNRCNRLKVPPGLDLQLDTAIPSIDIASDLFE